MKLKLILAGIGIMILGLVAWMSHTPSQKSTVVAGTRTGQRVVFALTLSGTDSSQIFKVKTSDRVVFQVTNDTLYAATIMVPGAASAQDVQANSQGTVEFTAAAKGRYPVTMDTTVPNSRAESGDGQTAETEIGTVVVE